MTLCINCEVRTFQRYYCNRNSLWRWATPLQTREPSRHLGSFPLMFGHAHAATKNNLKQEEDKRRAFHLWIMSGEEHVRRCQPVLSYMSNYSYLQNGNKSENTELAILIIDQLTKEIDFFPPTSLRQKLRIFLHKIFQIWETLIHRNCFGGPYIRFTISHDPKSNCLIEQNKKWKATKKYLERNSGTPPLPSSLRSLLWLWYPLWRVKQKSIATLQ